jgi:hypothetical protein
MRSTTFVRIRRAGVAAGAVAMALPVAGSAFANTPALPLPVAKRDVKLVVEKARRNVVAGHRTVVAGVAKNAGAGEKLVLEKRGAKHWHEVAQGRTRDGGVFRLRYTPRKSGSALLRVRLVDGPKAAAASIGRVKVFRDALVSWYGPGFYGGPLACGGAPLGYDQLGVANKTLPCGTMVTIRYNGRQVTVPVIDRGPYVGDREFDLTRATKDRLGFDGVGVVQVSIG